MATNEITTVQQSNTELNISNAENTKYLANELANFIKENNLYQKIQGKEHVNVEGWQYAGTRLGILPIIESVKDISRDSEIRYEASVKLKNVRTDMIVGAGFAMCSNKEAGKKFFQEYAIASMAQTRAIGKAYRNMLAWIIRAAGYEPTPLEEMESVEAERVERDNNAPQQRQTEPPMPPKNDVTVKLETHTDSFPITAEQSEKLTTLLSHQAFSHDYKNKISKKIDSYNASQADAMIKVLDDSIAKWKINNNQK